MSDSPRDPEDNPEDRGPSLDPPPQPRAPEPPPPQVVYVQQTSQQGNGLAVAALVLGIVGAVLFWTVVGGFLLGTLAVIFGAVGLAKANRGAPNKGLAIAGLVLGLLTIVGSIFMVVAVNEASKNADETFREIEACIDDPENC